MNKLSLILLFTLPLALMAQNKPILYMPFDGDVLNKSSVTLSVREHGVISYAPDRYGTPCKAARFDGSAYVEIMDHPVFNKIQKQFTVSIWFKFDKTLNPDTWLTILCKGDVIQETPNNPHFRAQIFQNPKQSTVSVNTEFTEHDRGYANHFFEPNKWSFYSLVYDGYSVSTYLNGNKIWSQPYNGTLNKNTSSLFIGKDIPGAIEVFKGYFDELKLFDYALSAQEINRLFHDGSTYNLVDYKIRCPQAIVVNNSRGQCGAKVNYYTPSLFSCDADSIRLVKGIPSGSFFPLGKTSIVFEVKRGAKKSVCKSSIEVSDMEPPIIVCPNDTIIHIGESIWQFEQQEPLYSDNCKIDTVIRSDIYKSVKRFKPGNYSISYMAIDVSSNKSTCTYEIKIISEKKDTIKPAVVVLTDSINNSEVKNDSIEIIESAYVSNSVIEDEIKIKGSYNFETEYVTMVIYDHNIEDGDSVSVYFNGNKIVDKKKVRVKKNGAIVKVLKLSLVDDNIIVIQALNMGTTGKNTVKVDFYDGKNVDLTKTRAKYSKVYNSEPGLATGIHLIFK